MKRRSARILPYRCGTMLLRADPEAREQIGRSWRDQEQRCIDWVTAHPCPKLEWLRKLASIRRMHKYEDSIRSRGRRL